MVGEKIPVIDLITELVTFFDESVLAKAESQIAAKFYHSNYNIPE